MDCKLHCFAVSCYSKRYSRKKCKKPVENVRPKVEPAGSRFDHVTRMEARAPRGGWNRALPDVFSFLLMGWTMSPFVHLVSINASLRSPSKGGRLLRGAPRWIARSSSHHFIIEEMINLLVCKVSFFRGLWKVVKYCGHVSSDQRRQPKAYYK